MINRSDPLVRLAFHTANSTQFKAKDWKGEIIKKNIKTDCLWESSVRSVPKEEPLFLKENSWLSAGFQRSCHHSSRDQLSENVTLRYRHV